MTLDDMNFDAYNAKQLDHIGRHLDGSEVAGSHFSAGSFTDARALVDHALTHIQDYNGQVLVREVDMGREVGYDAVVSLEGLPERATVTTEPRGRNEYLANMVSGVAKNPTNWMTIIAGPFNSEGTAHGFYTIHPGKSAPPFPMNEKELSETYKGDELAEKIELNKTHKQFWDTHGFIKE